MLKDERKEMPSWPRQTTVSQEAHNSEKVVGDFL